MNAKTLIAGTAVSLALMAATATPANAVITTFAKFSALTMDNFYYNNPTTNGHSTSATFYSIASPTSKVPGSVDVEFSYIDDGVTLDNAVKNATALFTLSGTTMGPAVLDPTTHNLEELVGGTFSFRSTTAITVGNHTYAAGSNLLSGTFTNAALSGRTSAGGLEGDNDAAFGDTLTYTSDFVSFVPGANLDAALSLSAVVPALSDAMVGTYALKTFKSDAGGQFSSDPAPHVNAVPEPASWALMMVGFGLAGASIRSRARRQAVA